MTTPRTERFGLVLSLPEREGLRYLAEIEGLAEADVLRRLLRRAINDLPPEHKAAINWQVPSVQPSSNRGSYRETKSIREHAYHQS